jgi:hypothetical protein
MKIDNRSFYYRMDLIAIKDEYARSRIWISADTICNLWHRKG